MGAVQSSHYPVARGEVLPFKVFEYDAYVECHAMEKQPPTEAGVEMLPRTFYMFKYEDHQEIPWRAATDSLRSYKDTKHPVSVRYVRDNKRNCRYLVAVESSRYPTSDAQMEEFGLCRDVSGGGHADTFYHPLHLLQQGPMWAGGADGMYRNRIERLRSETGLR